MVDLVEGDRTGSSRPGTPACGARATGTARPARSGIRQTSVEMAATFGSGRVRRHPCEARMIQLAPGVCPTLALLAFTR